MDAIHFSSEREDWETPGSVDRPGTFFFNLNKEFVFDLDACAHEMNAKLPAFLTEDDDALAVRWPGKRTFVNPPYARGAVLRRWLEKIAIESATKEVIVVLLAARTDTTWFHDTIWNIADEIRFVRGRLRHEIEGRPVLNKKTGEPQPAGFPSMIVVFRRRPMKRRDGSPFCCTMRSDGTLIEEGEAPL